MLDEAKRWFEAATVICKYVPDGDRRAAKVGAMLFGFLVDTRLLFKISETYSHLLARYAPSK